MSQKSQSVARLQREYRDLMRHPDEAFSVEPLDGDFFVWHFTIQGPPDTPFEGGVYHGQIQFQNDYPATPPDVVFFTPNGRFEVYKKICLTATSYHPETWTPSWGVRALLTSIISLMPTPAEGAIGAIDTPDEVRRQLAKDSHKFHCESCHLIESHPEPAEEQQGEVDPAAEGEESTSIEEPVEEKEEELEVKKNKKPLKFEPILDIPIIVLSIVLIGLIFDSKFHWLDHFIHN